MSLTLTSPEFREGELVPRKFTCQGSDVSPTLAWEGVPAATKSFALIVDDPDAPGGSFVHWVIYAIPASAGGLSEGVPARKSLDTGARQGVNDFGKVGYAGPCPPPGSPHRYDFKLYALDAELGLGAGASKSDLERAMRGHVLAEARLQGKYRR